VAEQALRHVPERFSLIVELLGRDADDVLDVGCRDRALSRCLPPGGRYVGLDREAPADVVASADEPLPFADRSFSAVVCADVLEHLENPHAALDEAMRVARSAVVVLLPNMFALQHRIAFLRGRMATDKYAFTSTPTADRHRWLMNVTQAHEFATGRAAQNAWRVARTVSFDGAFRHPLARASLKVARLLGSPDVWAWEYAARLEPQDAPRR